MPTDMKRTSLFNFSKLSDTYTDKRSSRSNAIKKSLNRASMNQTQIIKGNAFESPEPSEKSGKKNPFSLLPKLDEEEDPNLQSKLQTNAVKDWLRGQARNKKKSKIIKPAY